MKLLTVILLISFSALANESSFVSFQNGQVQIGQSYLNLSLKNFQITYTKPSGNVKASFIKGSLHWTRTKENIYTPQAEMMIQVRGTSKQMPYLQYKRKTHAPTFNSQKKIYTFSLSIALFQLNEVSIYIGDQILTTLEISAVPKKGIKSHYIDSSCAPYRLKVLNFQNQYLSMFCTLNKIGKIGRETPKLEVFWLTPNYQITSNSHHPLYTTSFTKSSTATIPLVNRNNKHTSLKMRVTLPKKLHRVKTALGIGPYQFKTHDTVTSATKSIIADVTLYGRIDLTGHSSLRFFDSFAKKSKSIFNNFGLYFAYDLARIYNDNIQIVALLGVQHISFKHSSQSQNSYQYIAPQGGEITYKHPFGIKNYVLGGGAFFSTNATINYTNAWIRFGKKAMVEFNYIEWGYNSNYAQTYGLSLIFPLVSFF